MTKESQVVTEVNSVVSSIRIKLCKKEEITLEDLDFLSSSISKLIADYKTAMDNYLAMNSLVVKHEKFLEVIGIIEYASAIDTDLLDKTINSLTKVSNTSLKQR